MGLQQLLAASDGQEMRSYLSYGSGDARGVVLVAFFCLLSRYGSKKAEWMEQRAK